MSMRELFWLTAAIVLATSCTAEKPYVPAPEIVSHEPGKVFARIESVSDPDTKVYTDENLKVLWDSDDRISLFNSSTRNKQYRFTGTPGQTEGEFTEVEATSCSGSPLDNVYAVYPYDVETTVSSDGIITMKLPSEQTYKDGSFGPGANAMVSVTADKNLLFKNLCGYLILKLYGDDVSVASITLEGKDHEPLAGTVNVTAAPGQNPSISFGESGVSSYITLTCPDPVALGTTAETATVFWMAVPPTTFSDGFKVTVKDTEGNIFEKSASSSFVILRNTTFRMKALKVDPEPVYLVTNEYVQKYLETVSYADMDFASGSVLRGSNFPGGVLYDNSITPDADIPPSVTVNWDYSTSSTLILDLQDDKGWSRSYSVQKNAKSLKVTNLVPGRHYSYKVHKDGSSEIKAEGGFYTRGALHQFFYESKVRNGRDLGGWKTLDGKTVSFRKLYRGGKLGSYLSSTGKSGMLSDGIKAEIDLREASDVSNSLGSSYAWCGPGFDRGYYPYMLDTRKDGIKECFEFTVDCLRNNKPVYFHCSAGRDRTGTLAILYLGLLGVREGDIARDYELTYFSPEEWSLETVGGEKIYNHTREVSTYRATVEYLASLSPAGDNSLKAGVEQYLLSIGVSQQYINDFRSIMLE